MNEIYICEMAEEKATTPETIVTTSSSTKITKETLPETTIKQAEINIVTSKPNIMTHLSIPETLRLVSEFDGNNTQLHQFIRRMRNCSRS